VNAPNDPRQEHAEWDALAVGWALSALDPPDEARFAAHLPGCDLCSGTVRESLGIVTELAYAVPAVTPPRHLKRRILEAVAAEPRGPALDPDLTGPGDQVALDGHPESDGTIAPQDQPARTGYLTADGHRAADGQAADGHSAADGRHPAPDGQTADVVPIGSRRRRWVVRTAVAAGLALIAGLGAWNVELRSRQDDFQQMVAQRDDLVARLTEQGPADITIIRDPDDAGSRYATVVVKQGRIGLITETLPPLSGNTTYWLWSLRSETDKNPVPLAGFTVPSTRFSACNIEPPAGLDTIRAFAISAEPGPERPTTPTDLIGLGRTLDG
jgi:hypothetical protein